MIITHTLLILFLSYVSNLYWRLDVHSFDLARLAVEIFGLNEYFVKMFSFETGGRCMTAALTEVARAIGQVVAVSIRYCTVGK